MSMVPHVVYSVMLTMQRHMRGTSGVIIGKISLRYFSRVICEESSDPHVMHLQQSIQIIILRLMDLDALLWLPISVLSYLIQDHGYQVEIVLRLLYFQTILQPMIQKYSGIWMTDEYFINLQPMLRSLLQRLT